MLIHVPTSASAEPRQSTSAPEISETLSQFVARVLNQLSLSAWLPAATLVLSLLVIFQLAAALDTQQDAARSAHPSAASTGPNTKLSPAPAPTPSQTPT